MKCSYTIDADHNLIHKIHRGNITVDDEIELLGTIFSDPMYHRGMNAICDYTDATVVWDFSELDRMRAYVSRVKHVAGECRWAIIVPKGKDQSTARIFIALHEAFEDTIRMKMFDTISEGLAWITSDRPAASKS